MTDRVWILGAADPEMELIEQLLRECGETSVYATDERGERVRGGTAYKARAEIPAGVRRVYLVECDVPEIPDGVERVVIDHHRPGDQGYGKGPRDFLEASSIGQAVRRLGQVAEYPDEWERVAVARHPHWCGAIERQGDRFVVRTVARDGDPGADDDDAATACVIPRELVLAAAADHCLGAAYRGECPGVDPDELMRWRAESRARFQKRDVNYLLADIERARQALREAPDLALEVTPGDHCGDGRRCDCREGGYGYGGFTSVGTGDCYCDCDGCQRGDYYITARDMRGRHVLELPEAAAREGICFVADGLPDRDGRVKIVCQNGTPRQILAFEAWAQSQRLVDFYGDPARGIAGAYKIAAASA